MEIALDPAMPTYSGGLGILAGDTLRSAADLGVHMVAVTLINHKGYFHQTLDPAGKQSETPESWNPADHAADTGKTATIQLDEHTLDVKIWRYDVTGVTGHVIPCYLLDTDLPQNRPYDRTISDSLYGGDLAYRLHQELVLGVGGLGALAALGHDEIEIFHMNEGHAALLTIGLLRAELGPRQLPSADDIERVRRRCVFTTHTPVPAGHDKFHLDLAASILGPRRMELIQASDALHDNMVNMTYLALRFSHYVNGVAMRHGEVSRDMFPEYPVRAITNGVHAVTWVSPAFQRLYDQHIPEWRTDNLYLRYAIGISTEEIAAAHGESKHALIEEISRRTGKIFREDVLTIGFARRATRYKRADLLFSDLDRLRTVASRHGGLQLVFAGKAHPADLEGKEGIQRIFQAAEKLAGDIPVVYLDNYDMQLASYLTSGVDVWLNTPRRPQEASGTSGMKAAMNGVPSLSILDGWWVEGCIEGYTGWAIGSQDLPLDDDRDEIASLYEKLEDAVAPLYYQQPGKFAEIRRWSIAINGSFFNTERMVEQYVENAYQIPQSISTAPRHI